MGKFVPLEIRNLEQLVTLLAMNDNFVLKKCRSTFRFHQKEHKERNNLFSLFKKRPFQNEDERNGSEKQNVLKNVIC